MSKLASFIILLYCEDTAGVRDGPASEDAVANRFLLETFPVYARMAPDREGRTHGARRIHSVDMWTSRTSTVLRQSFAIVAGLQPLQHPRRIRMAPPFSRLYVMDFRVSVSTRRSRTFSLAARKADLAMDGFHLKDPGRNIKHV